MKAVVEPSHFILSGEREILERVRYVYSYRDASIEHQIKRFKNRCRYLDRTGGFPGYDKWKKEQNLKLLEKLHVFCCDWVGETLSVPIGLLPSVTEMLQHTGLEIEDRRDFNVVKKRLLEKDPSFVLRRPQVEAIEAALKVSVGMIRMATGCGKTAVAQEIIRHHATKSIFLVPSKPILDQTVSRFRYAFGRDLVGVFGGGKKDHRFITVATYQSVYAAKAEDFEDYRLAAFDECAHIAAETFFEVAQNRLKNCVIRMGFSADEERVDGGTILVEAASGPVIYSYDAPQAIAEGYLARPTFFIYEIFKTEGSFIEWKTTKKGRNAVGLIDSERTQERDPHWAFKHWVVGNDYVTEHFAKFTQGIVAEGKSVLILVDEKEHGEKFIKIFEGLGMADSVGFVFGGGADNEPIMDEFNTRGRIKVVVGTSVIGEGKDTVPVDVLINFMGGRRPKQANGRALRNDPDENGVPRKPECWIIDFDFPLNETLHDQSLARQEIHRACGPIVKMKL